MWLSSIYLAGYLTESNNVFSYFTIFFKEGASKSNLGEIWGELRYFFSNCLRFELSLTVFAYARSLIGEASLAGPESISGLN